ncbi:beta-1,3-galactosyltransferase 5-like [Vanessa tameamea]|uniref:Hexosyltransferase n=1 Tax=Vanessa tameamea TaxID=334116 RepID=A0ABM4ATW5_VANTA|nr:beta-1,3-galactosyltransferase 5-like [Vanessa tameamea]
MGALGAAGALRRSHAVALVALAALLLLLLARSAPPPPPRPRPAPVPAPAPAAVPLDSAPPVPPASRIASSTRTARPANTTGHNATAQSAAPAAAAPAPTPAPRRDPRVVLTRDLYVAGHERPHPELCPALGAHLRLLVLVTSAPTHAAARDAVRLTWGHYAARRDVALAFVLGAPPASLRPALEAEDALYGDLVVGRSVDSYSNLTLKTLSMLEWADTYCPRAPRLLKTDDDMFINVPRLLRFAAAHENATRTVWGKVVKKSLPKRTTKSKYYISPLQFPGKVFPDFATGPAYLLTADAIRPLLEAAPAEPYLRLEDVFVTGVLAGKLRLRRQHAPEFYNKKVALHPCAVQRGIAIHMVQYHEQFDLWRKLLDGKTKCAS